MPDQSSVGTENKKGTKIDERYKNTFLESTKYRIEFDIKVCRNKQGCKEGENYNGKINGNYQPSWKVIKVTQSNPIVFIPKNLTCSYLKIFPSHNAYF